MVEGEERMKVILGKYRAPVMCRLFTDYMDRTHILGWPDEYSFYERFLEKLEDSAQWVLDHTVNPFRRKEGYEYIRIDYWDTWSMDHTLAPIILPMLRQLIDTKHGAPNVDPQDVPDELKPTAVELLKYQKDGETDEKFFARWDYVMDEMIYAFDCKANKDDVFMRFENPEEAAAEQERISNGFRLFGKYYEALWD